MFISPDVLEWALIHRTHVKSRGEYIKSLWDDFNDIEPYLPEKADSIVDIGCGMAGIDVLLCGKYPDARLELLDGDGGKENFGTGYHETMVPFNSRRVAEDFLESNGVKVSKWHDIGTREEISADVVISLYSMGWHYPIEYRIKAPVLICDVRGKPRGKPIREIIVKGKHKGFRCLITQKETR